MDELSTRDHPDWWRPQGGQNSQDSILERRSLVWNDDDILDGTVPDAFYEAETYKGKFFTRGCRGMIESIQLYCIGDATDEITLRYSPHPCLGPFGEVTIVPAAAWAWQDFPIEEMWDYDSMFIWVYEAEANVDWAYDAVLPFDGHESGDTGATWFDLDIRPFIRVVYTGETPGDVPVSGIINNIPIPNHSSILENALVAVPQNVETLIVEVEGAGYCDLIEFFVNAAANSHQTILYVYCDDVQAMGQSFIMASNAGYTTATPRISLSAYGVAAFCNLLISKRFEFRRRLQVTALNINGPQTVTAWVMPTLLG